MSVTHAQAPTANVLKRFPMTAAHLILPVTGGWPNVPPGTGVQSRHNFNSRGAGLFAFFFSAKGPGLDLTLTTLYLDP
ncbi:MAG TPA: hypothetical protein VN901_27225 [Candidatus Acidoferrales bacterium]|nr:hypothetical protein [Candidatus Acidoferrales bacterium]